MVRPAAFLLRTWPAAGPGRSGQRPVTAAWVTSLLTTAPEWQASSIQTTRQGTSLSSSQIIVQEMPCLRISSGSLPSVIETGR